MGALSENDEASSFPGLLYFIDNADSPVLMIIRREALFV